MDPNHIAVSIPNQSTLRSFDSGDFPRGRDFVVVNHHRKIRVFMSGQPMKI